MSDVERFVVRPRFWPAWLFFTLFLQLLSAITIVACVALRFVLGQPRFGWDDALGCSVGFAGCVVGGSIMAWVGCRWHGAELSTAGVRPFQSKGRRQSVQSWEVAFDVRRTYRWPSGRMFVICTVSGVTFTLPERPSDFDGFRAAVERFAGEAHPLARALAEVAEEG